MNLIDFTKEYLVSSGNGKWCEDITIINNSLVGVLDGATPIDIIEIDNYQTQACWFVNEFVRNFLNEDYGPINSVNSFCKAIINKIDCSKISEFQDYNYPCCTAAFVRINNKYLLCSIIGDCSIYVRLKNRAVIHFYDDRVDKFSKKTQIISQKDYANMYEKESAIKQQKINNRKHLNNPDGFYALTLCDSWYDSFVENQIAIADVDSVLICSDGFARLFKEYNIMSPQAFFNNDISILDGVSLIRNFEKKSLANYSCVKKKDDASAILLDFKREEKYVTR